MKSERLRSRIKDIQISDELNISDILKDARVDYTDDIKYPPIMLEYKEGVRLIRVCTYGNFSALVGKQKSRKTFFMSLLMSACVKNDFIQYFRGKTTGRKNILFDTEQARYDVKRVNNRICKMAGFNGQPDNLDTYSLRAYTPEERVEIIDHVLSNTSHIGFVIIDGVRDLVTDVNDSDQATEITTKLMQWTENYDCHISVGLHLNKGINAELRGHLGTEIQNKAESVIEVEKFNENKNYSIVKARDFRGEIFENFAFTIDDNGFPIIDLNFKANDIF